MRDMTHPGASARSLGEMFRRRGRDFESSATKVATRNNHRAHF